MYEKRIPLPLLTYSHFVHPIPYSRSEKNIISHKNNDPEDNRAENLQLITRRDFSRWQILTGISLPLHQRKVSQESRERIRLSRCRAVSQFSGQGKFIRTYESMTEASRITGVQSTNIGSNISGKTKSAGGFIWRLGTSNQPLSKKQIDIFQNRKYNKQRPINQYDLAENLIKTHINTTKAALVAGLDRRTFCDHLTRKGSVSHNGYLWRFIDSEIE